MAEKINSIGRRKEATARIFVKSSSGTTKVIINGKDYKTFFPQVIYQKLVEQALEAADGSAKYDFIVNVKGGGIKGQAEATRLGIARAMVKENSELKPKLRSLDLLTRDPRAVERKKPGRKKARKRFQFSKR
jgi:small subunit ribosomal protein S9